MNCEKCVHNKVCALWRSQECQSAATYSYSPDGCAYYDPVEEDSRELRKAIKTLRKKYEEAKKNEIVRDPLAYALYHTWQDVSAERARKEN